MNIISATWANAERSAVNIETDQAGAVIVGLAESERLNSGGWREVLDEWMRTNTPCELCAPLPTRAQKRSAMFAKFLTLPVAVRGQFAVYYAAVDTMLTNGDDAGARACMAGVVVPLALEPLKAELLAIFDTL